MTIRVQGSYANGGRHDSRGHDGGHDGGYGGGHDGGHDWGHDWRHDGGYDEEHYGGHGGIMQKNAFSGASEMTVHSKGNGPIRNRMLDLGIYK